MDNIKDCALCAGRDADSSLLRVQTWENDYWRLTTSIVAETPGFSYLEPKRHIEDMTALDGEEAATLGPVLSLVSRVLRDVTGSEMIYLYVFGGGIPHLHIHLAPHTAGDALNQAIVKGKLSERRHPSGAVIQASEDYPLLDEGELRAVAERVKDALRKEAPEIPRAR